MGKSSMDGCDILPHGAKGIESEDFAIEFRGDKIVVIQKSAGGGRHFTLHAGRDSGIIDLHETEPAAEAQTHRTLFAMQRDDLLAVLGESSAIVPDLMRLFRPLRLGWL